MWKALVLVAVSIAFVAVSIDVGDGGTGNVATAVKDQDYKAVADVKGETWCPGKRENNVTGEVLGKKCDDGSFAHYYNCCGTNNGDCCFALQLWVYIVIGVLVLISIVSTILGIVCCCCK